MVLSDFAKGTILALLAAIAFGTQTSFAKVSSVISCKIRMEMFNIYFMIGVAIICLIGHLILVLFFDHIIEFSSMGIISAFSLSVGELFMLLSVQQIGVAYGMALSVLSSAVASIIIQYILGQYIQNYAITIIGLFVVTLSVISCAFLKKILSFINIMNYNDTEKSILLMPKQESVINILSETQPLMINKQSDETEQSDDDININNDNVHFVKYSKKMILGFIYSSIGGICYCSVPLPSLYVNEFSAGIRYSLSFGIGCLIVLPLSIINIGLINPLYKEDVIDLKQLYWRLITFDEELWNFKSAGLAAICGGCVWGIGNLMGICTFLYLDYVIVMVYVQFHIIFSLLWGVCLWKEITQKIEMIALSLLTLTLIGGCVLVTYGVYGTF